VRKEDVVFFKPREENDELKMQKGEGLCAVCFTKRFYDVKESFPSTAEIAAMDWLSKIDEKNKNDYKELFNNFDEQLFYEENLREKYLQKYGYYKNNGSIEIAKQKLKRFYDIKIDENKKLGKPSKYYALIMSDGDNMGKWLSGEFLQDEAKKNLKNFHVKMSKELGNYAKSLGNNSKDDNENNNKDNRIIEPKGKLVYAGGDDVMAFVNLKHLFDVLIKLREKFPKFEALGFNVKDNHRSTASAGVVIAHYKTPLSEILKWARKMEKDAKDKGGRDAFAIAVLKHSGEINKTIFKWQLEDIKPIELMRDICQKIQNEEFSNTFIKSLNIEFLKLMDKEGKWGEKQAIKTEIKRLTLKSFQRKKDETKENFNKRKDKISNEFIPELGSFFSNSKKLNNFLSFLNIVDFLSREAK
jgi:CRISPR-associated protein Cmr2